MSLRIDPHLCAICRGRNWCGLSYCPLIARRLAIYRLSRVVDSRELFGTSPPSVFVGRRGYPYVNLGPSTPPETGDTSIYDLPEKWIGIKLEDILRFRWSLVTGSTRVRVDDTRSRLVEKLHELVLSYKPVDVEVLLKKPPKPVITFSEFEPPQGPRAPLQDFRIAGNPSIPRIVDRLYNDPYVKASDAIIKLYEEGFPVSYIQRVFSTGALGRWSDRRLVPTRWSITAIDSIISGYLLKKVKEFPEINRIEVYVRRYYDNLFIAILVPGKWSFEWMEAWWPGSTWNPGSSEVVVEGDYEGFHGRSTYPEIGGCYYATRLAVAEHLYSRGRQAVVIVLREIYPGFNLPIGVWFVRENIRAMLRSKPVLTTNDLREVVELLERETKLGAKKWIESSRLLQRLLFIRRIEDFFVEKK
ncbi:MAG: Nre family DNA repair protein [Thermoprotei archaeon]